MWYMHCKLVHTKILHKFQIILEKYPYINTFAQQPTDFEVSKLADRVEGKPKAPFSIANEV